MIGKTRKKTGKIRALPGLVAALALTGSLGAAAATAHAAAPAGHAQQTKRVYNGMQIAFPPNSTDLFCTIGAVGTDDHQRKIAISAGHCIRDKSGKYADHEIPDDIIPVVDRNDAKFGPIGYVRYFKDPEGSQTGHATKDYMVIELLPTVTLSSQGPYLKQTGVLKYPKGPVSPNAMKPALDTERLLTTGNNEIITSGQTGVWYGTVMNNDNGIYRAPAVNKPGDSGGPVIWHVPGTDLPSQANKFQAAGPWAGITKAITLQLPPFNYTSSANILADLRTREAADPKHDIYGAGFEVTPNP
ncbi:hypothetical protein GCM10010211_69380 [Streptomyces albospinus]|uniref:Peptidase S1 domain-containing protein n=1 Tax=Streptomyces albospinus TaxID=285515 RepID=A0ABQ2VN44_9ACTN|nr:S1 family peptidase [Streptomyces albospinus]GGU92752.1 hypothetical protein GCM10010211_69380 [Streptomyces albospinus]